MREEKQSNKTKMENETENKLRELIRGIQQAESRGEKSRLMVEMGDLRIEEYQRTRDLKQRQLAANCYIAARRFAYTLA